LHEFLVDLFRRRPVLALELLRACAGIRLAGATAELGSIDLTQVAPTEYRSDALTVLRDPAGKAIAAVIVEVQLWSDEDKRRTWPLYVAAARARYGCPATLLVLAPELAVARWASQPIDLGHPRFVLYPIALSYAQIPRICDAATARAAPQLAVLSAMAHPDLETVEAAEACLAELSEDEQKLYWDVIMSSLPELVRRAVEVRMIKGYEYQSDFARKYYSQGLEKGRNEGLEKGRNEGLEKGRNEGREEGRNEGREEGRNEGREEGLRDAIIALVCGRLPGLRDELESRLRAQPEARLVQLITELDQVHDEAGVRAVLDRRT
jgi:flagellar biosynthesis/type III secretory pathway protein FliH